MTKFVSISIAIALVAMALPTMAGEYGPRANQVDLEPSLVNPAEDGGGQGGERNLPYRSRSPILAGGLSLLLPGAGQLYNEQYVVGSLWMAAEIGLYLAAFSYAGAFDDSEKFSLRFSLESTILLAVATGFHLFSVFDAVTEAARVNKDLEKFKVSYNPNTEAYSVGYAFDW